MKEVFEKIYDHPMATVVIILAIGNAASKIAKALRK